MPLYLYNGVLMVVTFFLFRVIGGTGACSNIFHIQWKHPIFEAVCVYVLSQILVLPNNHLLCLSTVLSFEYWRATQLELSHPRPGGIPVAIIYLYRKF